MECPGTDSDGFWCLLRFSVLSCNLFVCRCKFNPIVLQSASVQRTAEKLGRCVLTWNLCFPLFTLLSLVQFLVKAQFLFSASPSPGYIPPGFFASCFESILTNKRKKKNSDKNLHEFLGGHNCRNTCMVARERHTYYLWYQWRRGAAFFLTSMCRIWPRTLFFFCLQLWSALRPMQFYESFHITPTSPDSA